VFDQYKIAVRVALLDELSVPLAQVARHLATTEEAATKLQTRMASMRAYFTGGLGLIGAGATMAAPLLYAIDKAAQFQKQMIAVQIATRGTTEQMTEMRRVIEGVSGVTIFSSVDVAKMAKIIATGTGLGASQVQSLLPAYAKYADVQSLMKDTPYTTSITDAIRAAHGAQHYDAESLKSYLDLLTKASLIIPGNVGEVTKALAYFQGVSKMALGMSDEDSVLAVAMANRLGFAGTRGGTRLTAAFTRTIPGIFGSGLLTGKSGEALADMGLADAQGHAKVFEKGKFSILKWMGLTADFVSKEFASHPEAIARQNIMKDFQRAYGANGSPLAATLGSDAAIAQWKQLAEQFEEYGGFEGMQQKFADYAVWQQYQNALTNFQNSMMELGITLLPTASAALKTLNAHLGEVIAWMNKNPGQVKQYAKDIAYFSAALAGLGVVSVATSAIIGLTTVIGALGKGAQGLAARSAVGGLAGAAAGGGALTAAAAVGLGLGWAADHFFPNNPLAKLGDWIGSERWDNWYNLIHGAPDGVAAVSRISSATHGQIQRTPFIMPRLQPEYFAAPVIVNLDGKVLFKSQATFFNKAVTAPQTGISGFDGSQSLARAGGVGGE
jgi:TP901 family phage tail tape measure protein